MSKQKSQRGELSDEKSSPLRMATDIRALLESTPPENNSDPTEPRPIKLIDALLRALIAEKVTTVFGVPGGLLHPFFDAVECSHETRLFVTKHECGAAFMADGYARTSGKMPVVAATSGPGATNLLTGVSCAFADGVPMLVITGQAQSKALGKGAAQETAPEDIDIVGMFKPVTKYSALVLSPEHLAHHFRRAMRLALSGRPGPVHLNVPVDYWMAPVQWQTWGVDSYRPPAALFDRQQVAHAARALLASTRLVLLVGSGAAGPAARKRTIEVAEFLGARVATTPRAKGVFPENHALSLGVLGFAGHAAARRTLIEGEGEADLLFTIGASLNETTTLNWHPMLTGRRTLVQLDIDNDRIGRNYAVDVPLLGDAGTILLELLFQLKRDVANGHSISCTWGSAPPTPRGEARYMDPEQRSSLSVPLSPARWRKELSDVLPDDAIVYSDIGGHMLFNIQHLEIRLAQRFLLNLGFGSMGHGTAACIGSAIASPGRPVVSIIGDACFTMLGMELLTAVEYDIPVIWIVENNQMHGITWHGSKLVNGGRPMQSIVYKKPLRVDDLARAMGLSLWKVTAPNQVASAFQQALAAKRPCLIDVHTDPSQSPPLGERAKTVAGFKR